MSAQYVQSHMLTALGLVASGMQTRPHTDRCPQLQVPPPRQTAAGGPWLDNTVCGNVRGTLEVVAVVGTCMVISAVRIVKPLPPPPPIDLADLCFDDERARSPAAVCPCRLVAVQGISVARLQYICRPCG